MNTIVQNNSIKWVTSFWDIVNKKYTIPRNSNFKLPDRTWPDKDIEKAPIWCSSCLRDWNQSIKNTMSVEEKYEIFFYLVNIWFKEIEVWFPSASQADYDFVRKLIDENLIPLDVKIQVLVQSRKDLIEITRKSVEWAKNVIIHMYNSTSTNQREVVFKKTKDEIIDLAINWIWWIKDEFINFPWNITFQYSPESFTWTEMDFTEEISRNVIEEWWDYGWNDIILNLPATVENTTPDRYADKIEYFSRIVLEYQNRIKDNIWVILSVHTHNDRWTWVAATELALKAWADRVEGTLLWNWERTWNVDIITLWLNMATQGVNPELDFRKIWLIATRVSEIIEIPINPRHPYIWELVHTAFSWGHQDAIAKWLKDQKHREQQWDMHWEVPYLPIDPRDLSLNYLPIQINSQSWKWWVCSILWIYWYKIPKEIEPCIWRVFQKITNKTKWTLSNDEIKNIFEENFINVGWNISYNFNISDLIKNSEINHVWLIDQLFINLQTEYNVSFEILNYQEIAIQSWSNSNAFSWFKIEFNKKIYYGFWIDKDINHSAVKWLISTLNIAINHSNINWSINTLNFYYK